MSTRGRSVGDSSPSGSEYEASEDDISSREEAEQTENSSSFEDDTDASGAWAHDTLDASNETRPHDDAGVAKKRGRSRRQRLRGGYRPKYRQLFNSEIEDIVEPSRGIDIDFEESTLGVSEWTAAEKLDLFASLEKHRGNARAIASTIGTKSEYEVQDYLELLNQGTVEALLRPNLKSNAAIGLDEIPAAFEVGARCESALDMVAERLAYKVEMQDEEQEKQKHGDYWLLTREVAEQIEASLQTKDDQQHEPPPAVPAAALLNLPRWLELASLFMTNSSDGEIGWKDLIEHKDQRPSIYNTAFGDFERLAVTLTKRLAQVSMFQAMSRLRATHKGRRHERELCVRHQDVQAACRIIGLKESWTSYWVHAPRRMGLDIGTRGKCAGADMGKLRVLDYDTVEQALRAGNAEFEVLDDSVADSPSQEVITSVETDPDPDSPPPSDSDFYTDEDEADDSTTSNPVKAETAYLEALDQHASQAHEATLWDILAKPAAESTAKRERPKHTLPSPPPKPELPPLPPRPARMSRAERKEHAQELLKRQRWREVENRPCWTGPGRAEFDAMGLRGRERKRRRLEKQRPEEDVQTPEEATGDDEAPGEEDEVEEDETIAEEADANVQLDS